MMMKSHERLLEVSSRLWDRTQRSCVIRIMTVDSAGFSSHGVVEDNPGLVQLIVATLIVNSFLTPEINAMYYSQLINTSELMTS